MSQGKQLNSVFYFKTRIMFYIGYDAALYSAASSYYQQQQAAKVTGTWSFKKAGTTGTVAKNGVAAPKPKLPPKQPQLHYCDVCKISCAGPQVSTGIGTEQQIRRGIKDN